MIMISGKKYSMPFSHGILASSLLRAGAAFTDSYDISRKVQRWLVDNNMNIVTEDALADVVEKLLIENKLDKIAINYQAWRKIRKQKLPIVILIGGVTGIGKSTVAREVAYRLGIGNVIGSDTIREVMRKMISLDLAPALHSSSFLVYKNISVPAMIDQVVYSFQQQQTLVAVGLNAIVQRAEKEGYNTVIEGVHAIPGSLDIGKGIFHFILYLPDLEEHKSRLHSRSRDTLREANYYIDKISNINKIQNYIIEQAKKHDVLVILNENFEETVTQIIDHVISTLAEEALFLNGELKKTELDQS